MFRFLVKPTSETSSGAIVTIASDNFQNKHLSILQFKTLISVSKRSSRNDLQSLSSSFELDCKSYSKVRQHITQLPVPKQYKILSQHTEDCNQEVL